MLFSGEHGSQLRLEVRVQAGLVEVDPISSTGSMSEPVAHLMVLPVSSASGGRMIWASCPPSLSIAGVDLLVDPWS